MAKTWLVTGAAGGLGRAVAEAILGHGDNLVAGARDPARLEDLHRHYGNSILPIAMDVANPDDVRAAVDAGLAKFGSIDVLVNNAGYGIAAAFEQTSAEAFEAQIATNLFGTAHGMRAVLPHMRRQRSGTVINVSSAGGRRAVPGFSAYCAAKFAVGGLSEVVAQEAAPFGVRVVAVEPGSMRSNFANVALATAPLPDQDYEASVGTFLAAFRDVNGHEAADLSKVAAVILSLPDHPTLPAHLVLGSDAFTLVRAANEQSDASMLAWEKVSRSTDADDADLSWLKDF
ncbi:SDR family NAD(P)-dependent oxidoreductase [Sphingobium sp. PNB]|uniref:SDR family NAD(P)-dependent oxidoreductase n=1 Tax=Sphingobium sp. PNB TaxID=863934 RepID=UPI001CA394DB|nr:SDR family NAD(P)-dependent oxidoreductase [Sphingobium sp. PNB]MCB4858456.1 SDR family NAD(P)-dependent oxidoreductase [Sphingobium sp. PNB]